MNRRDFLKITFAGATTIAIPTLASGQTAIFTSADITGESVGTLSFFDKAGKLLGAGQIPAFAIANGKAYFGNMTIQFEEACTPTEFMISTRAGAVVKGSVGATGTEDFVLTSSTVPKGGSMLVINFAIDA